MGIKTAGEEFPTVAPPWDAAWMEYITPRTVNLAGDIQQVDRSIVGRRHGSLIIPFGLDKEGDDFSADCLMSLETRKQCPEITSERKAVIDSCVAKGRLGRWVVYYGSCYECGSRVIGPTEYFFYLDQEGKVIDMPYLARGPRQEWYRGLFPFFFATSLLHCKNVELIDKQVPGKVQHQRSKKGPAHALRYKLVKVDPLRKQIHRANAERGERGNEIKHALHICRGHFKDYRESGLFGRYFGVYWWDMHVRGDGDYGEIVKEYEVGAPRDLHSKQDVV